MAIDFSTQQQYLALIRDGIRQGQLSEQKRILDLLKEELCDEPDCVATYEHAHCQVVKALMNRIEGKTNEETY